MTPFTMSQSKFYCLVLFLCIFGFSPLAMAAKKSGETPYQHVIQASESCNSCHEKNRVEVFKTNMAGDCAQCHSDGDDGAVMPVAEKKFSDPYADKLKVAPPPGATAGMSVPMFYNETRFGKEPHEMILIPAGEFIRGTNQRLSDEGPQHKVSLGDFYIDKYEVTNLQYKQFIDAPPERAESKGSVSAAKGRMPEVAAMHRKSPDHFENRMFPEGKADHPLRASPVGASRPTIRVNGPLATAIVVANGNCAAMRSARSRSAGANRITVCAEVTGASPIRDPANPRADR